MARAAFVFPPAFVSPLADDDGGARRGGSAARATPVQRLAAHAQGRAAAPSVRAQGVHIFTANSEAAGARGAHSGRTSCGPRCAQESRSTALPLPLALAAAALAAAAAGFFKRRGRRRARPAAAGKGHTTSVRLASSAGGCGAARTLASCLLRSCAAAFAGLPMLLPLPTAPLLASRERSQARQLPTPPLQGSKQCERDKFSVARRVSMPLSSALRAQSRSLLFCFPACIEEAKNRRVGSASSGGRQTARTYRIVSRLSSLAAGSQFSALHFTRYN